MLSTRVIFIDTSHECVSLVNPSLVRWDTPGNCSNHGEILEHPGGIKTELKHWNISSLSKNYPLKM